MAKRFKKLKWGETPFDLMSHKDLLLATKRIFYVMVQMNGILSMIKTFDGRSGSDSAFWNAPGRGYRTLKLAEVIGKPLHEEYSFNQIWRSFFRLAAEAMFPDCGEEPWVICPKCSDMSRASTPVQTKASLGKRCSNLVDNRTVKCSGILRRLTLEDIETLDDRYAAVSFWGKGGPRIVKNVEAKMADIAVERTFKAAVKSLSSERKTNKHAKRKSKI